MPSMLPDVVLVVNGPNHDFFRSKPALWALFFLSLFIYLVMLMVSFICVTHLIDIYTRAQAKGQARGLHHLVVAPGSAQDQSLLK